MTCNVKQVTPKISDLIKTSKRAYRPHIPLFCLPFIPMLHLSPIVALDCDIQTNQSCYDTPPLTLALALVDIGQIHSLPVRDCRPCQVS